MRIIAFGGVGFMVGIGVSMLLIMDLGLPMFTDNPFGTWFLIELLCIVAGGLYGWATGKKPMTTTA